VITWKALVVFQSSIPVLNPYTYPPHLEEFLLYSRDPRIQFVTYTGGARANCAGDVRNYALQFVTTDWVAFLDDDDTLSLDYVRYLLKEMRLNPTAELVSFRMFDERIADPNNLLKVLPEEHATDTHRDHIGISFAFKRTHSRLDVFVNSITEDYLFIHNFCYDSGRLCILSPYVTYYVKGQKPENRVSAGNRTIIRALPAEMQLGHVVESIDACYVPHEQNVVPGRHMRITSSGEPGTPEQLPPSSPLGLKLKLHDTAKSCSLNYESISGVHVSLNFAKLHSKTRIYTIFVVHSGSQLVEVLRLAKQSFLWTTSNELKKKIVSAGFDSTRIQVINPWSILDMNDFGPCLHRNALSVRSAETGEASQLSVSLLDTRADDISGVFERFCAQVQFAGFRATCTQGNFDDGTLLHACSTDIVIFFFHDTIPEWLPVEYLILREKIVLFHSDCDRLLNDFFSNFAYNFDSPATALSTIVTISKNWHYFSDVSRRAAMALRKVIDDSYHEELCIALHEYAVVRAREISPE